MLMMALNLIEMGHHVTIYTSFYDPNRSFKESKDKRINLHVIGHDIPANINGKLTVVMTLIKLFCLSYCVPKESYDFIITDMHPFPLLFFKIRDIFSFKLQKPKYLFYCHFPDKLLCTDRKSILKKLFRIPFDLLEELSMHCSDYTMVNSEYTRGVYKKAFKTLSCPDILFPVCVKNESNTTNKKEIFDSLRINIKNKLKNDGTKVLLSINRFSAEKNLSLAIRTLSFIKKQKKFSNVKVIIAGGYDALFQYNVNYFNELLSICKEENLSYSNFPNFDGDVVFYRSFKDEEKPFLFSISRCLLYTSLNEHFGITPVDAMSVKLPVIGTNTGGLLETIVDGETGFLCEPNAKHFAEAVVKIINSDDLFNEMGENGLKRVQEKFSEKAFSNQLETILNDLADNQNEIEGRKKYKIPKLLLILFVTLMGSLMVIK